MSPAGIQEQQQQKAPEGQAGDAGASGGVAWGVPIAPAVAYKSQTVPDPYYLQPPRAYYATSESEPVVGVPIAAPQQKGAAPLPPPAYYYGPPAGWQPPEAAPPPPRPLPQGAPPPAPSAEETADFSDGSHHRTDARYRGDVTKVTHVNYHANRLTSIGGLEQYPNLLRLTVSWNDLRSLQGVGGCKYLRWIDAAGNHLQDLSGLADLLSLEWLNLENSDIRSFRGLSACPSLTWLCLHHNWVSDFSDARNLSGLQFLDVSDNDVRHVRGLEQLTSLRELNLANNPMCEGDVQGNVASVKALAKLPNLFRLNITDTFYDPEEADVVAYFRTAKPDCELITTEGRSAQLGHNIYWSKGKAKAGRKGCGCCSVM
eukprot:TRINITY_DN9345_c0_g1_i1.p1 TRINITY_DN9345_c0_g1~~TRINITY_DN9345_c0_g1_i1.p1  ORF type:complete len:372 (+),score=95.91 TRINITY_DN9345_c0_g1_i1:122-1237(+)